MRDKSQYFIVIQTLTYSCTYVAVLILSVVTHISDQLGQYIYRWYMQRYPYSWCFNHYIFYPYIPTPTANPKREALYYKLVDILQWYSSMWKAPSCLVLFDCVFSCNLLNSGWWDNIRGALFTVTQHELPFWKRIL